MMFPDIGLSLYQSVRKSLLLEGETQAHNLFQRSLDQGIVPQDWIDAIVVPMYQKEEKT